MHLNLPPIWSGALGFWHCEVHFNFIDYILYCAGHSGIPHRCWRPKNGKFGTSESWLIIGTTAEHALHITFKCKVKQLVVMRWQCSSPKYEPTVHLCCTGIFQSPCSVHQVWTLMPMLKTGQFTVWKEVSKIGTAVFWGLEKISTEIPFKFS